MISRLTRVLLLIVLTAGLALFPPAAALADDAPDTTAPQVDINPCADGETSCRRVYAQVYGDLQPDDDLAVLGARIGDRVLGEHVYDDGSGSGFQPYGYFGPYGNDVLFPVDYALSVAVPRGTSEITFYARDLEGNTSELTTTVLGPIPPGPVERLRAKLVAARRAWVSWNATDLQGSCCAEFLIRTPGREPKSTYTAPPGGSGQSVQFRKLSVGWHRFTVRARTAGGTGPSNSVRLYVPRPSRGR